MLAKINALLRNEGTMFLISNLIYSFSTYLIALLIPYKLNIESMAGFSAAFNIIIMLIFVFEFGLTVSYLRFNQIYQISDQVNALFQVIIFLLLFVLSQTILGHYTDIFFGVQNLGIKQEYIYLSIFAMLTWIFFKTTLLAKKRIGFITVNSVIILVARIAFLVYILFFTSEISLDDIYLYLFILPFGVVIIINTKYTIGFLSTCTRKVTNIHFRRLFYKRAKQFVIFSALTYVINGLFIYTNRYAIIYMVDHKMTTILAELGYAMSFGGLIMIFISSLRSYFISKFNMSDMTMVTGHIQNLIRYKWHVLIGGCLISTLIALLVYLIKPGYLSMQSVIFVFILIYESVLIAYLSLFSLLSKTFNFNVFELKLNIIRLILVILVVQLIFVHYPVSGFIVLNLAILLVEFYFARSVIRKIYEKVKLGERTNEKA